MSSEYLNKDGTFKGGFDGCVAYMTGKYGAEGAKKICGKIAQNVSAKDAGPSKAMDMNKPDDACLMAAACSKKAIDTGTMEDHLAAAKSHEVAAKACRTKADQYSALASYATAAPLARRYAIHAKAAEAHSTIARSPGMAASVKCKAALMPFEK